MCIEDQMARAVLVASVVGAVVFVVVAMGTSSFLSQCGVDVSSIKIMIFALGVIVVYRIYDHYRIQKRTILAFQDTAAIRIIGLHTFDPQSGV